MNAGLMWAGSIIAALLRQRRALALAAVVVIGVVCMFGCAPVITSSYSEIVPGTVPVEILLVDDTYKAVKIGDVTWMTENLNVKNGNSWCFNNDPAACNSCGRLYDWKTATNICPAGWRLPTRQEWLDLAAMAGGGNVAANRLKAKNIGAWSGTDDYGFSAKPCGLRDDRGNYFGCENEQMDGCISMWWTSDKADARLPCGPYTCETAYATSLSSYGFGSRGYVKTQEGLSVRCVLDEGETPSIKVIGGNRGTQKRDENKEQLTEEQKATMQRLLKLYRPFTDQRDGQLYRIVTIGGKTWMAENLKYQPKEGNFWCYENNSSACQLGKLYDWSTAKTVCPDGWRLPEDSDLSHLVTTAGGKENAGKALKFPELWYNEGNGEDTYGFSAIGAGFRSPDGTFDEYAKSGVWWTAGESGTESDKAKVYVMSYQSDEAMYTEMDKKTGLSVRCVQK